MLATIQRLTRSDRHCTFVTVAEDKATRKTAFAAARALKRLTDAAYGTYRLILTANRKTYTYII